MTDIADVFPPLIEACQRLGLTAALYRNPPRLRVSAPGSPGDLAELVRCAPDEATRLYFWWSWGEPIGPADKPEQAARALRRVVTTD
jgi:hypothetical protein